MPKWKVPGYEPGQSQDPKNKVLAPREIVWDAERNFIRVGNGSDLGGVPLVSPYYREESASIPNPVNLRSILLDRQVSRMLAGAGDGEASEEARAEETRKFQAMADQGRSFSVPEPSVTFAVNTIRVALGQTIEGSGQYGSDQLSNGGKFQFSGNGVDPVFQVGNGSGSSRHQTLRDLSVINDGGQCIQIANAPNVLLDRIRALSSGGANTIVGTYSYRAAIRDSTVSAVAGGTAIDFLDNVNGLTIDHTTVTGGSLGRAIRIGQSQAICLINNVIESSLEGIWISSTHDPGDGLCSGVILEGNYVEQCKTPFVLGIVFPIQGLKCSANYISNKEGVISKREASIQFGRIFGGSIQDNVIYPHQNEYIFRVWLTVPTGDCEDLSVVRNRVNGKPAQIYQVAGDYAANSSVRATIGAECHFDFMGDGLPIGTPHIAEWISPIVDAAIGTPMLAWLPDRRKVLGGKIKSVEISDHNGGTHSGVAVAIGRATAPSENVDVPNMATLQTADGLVSLPLKAASIFDRSSSVYRVIGAQGQTAKFRIRIRYRAN